MVTIKIAFDAARVYRREERFVLGNILRTLAAQVDIFRGDGKQEFPIDDDDGLEIGKMTIDSDPNDPADRSATAEARRDVAVETG